ncbi:hypothetical protein H0H92_013766, partial [Tricholoma furcatifolium]
GSDQYYVQAGGQGGAFFCFYLNDDSSALLVAEPDPYYRSMTPMVASSQHYTSTGHRYYQNPTGGSSSLANATTYPQSQYYPTHGQYQRSDIHASDAVQFIPTPSEMIQDYPPQRQVSIPPQSPTSNPYSSTPYNPSYMPSAASPEHRPTRIATGRPSTSPGSPTNLSSPTGERFPCDKCGKTFSRSHDRKRHHETQHLATPVTHRCRYCSKEFSRYVLEYLRRLLT